MKVAKTRHSCQSRDTCNYSETKYLLFVEHVEYVDIFHANWIVKVFSSKCIFKIDDMSICRKIIIENLSISNYYIVFFILYIDPRLCFLGLGRLIRDVEYILSISDLFLEAIESKVIRAEDNGSFRHVCTQYFPCDYRLFEYGDVIG